MPNEHPFGAEDRFNRVSIMDSPIAYLSKPTPDGDTEIREEILQAMLWVENVVVDATGVDPTTMG